MENQIVNRVAASSLVTFDLEELYVPGERVVFDLKDFLYQEIILREKDFRQHIKDHNWNFYKDKQVAMQCTVDAIIPTWAFMMVASALQPFAKSVVVGSLQDLETYLFLGQLQKVDWHKYLNAKVTVKGCSKVEVPTSAYVEAINKLNTVASSVMFGEACSTVPIFKQKK
ncbi:MAG: DUF2480 family protein [Bacteroidetes bacterium]|nr:DUF2480 family protein [Bacteroidota bacterium]MBS1540425.1 DUF2480 family protein [Bacteroidota bacterium]